MINDSFSYVSWAQMSFQPKKCAVIGFQKDYTSSLHIGNDIVPSCQGKDRYKYLGIHRSQLIQINPHDLYEKIVQMTDLVSKSALLPWQKLMAYKVFIHSKLIFSFRNYKTATCYLENSQKTTKSEGMHKGLDFSIRRFIKSTYGLSKAGSNHFIYSPIECEELGFISLFDEYNIQSIIQLHRIFNSKDSKIRHAAKDWICEVSQIPLFKDALLHITNSSNKYLQES